MNLEEYLEALKTCPDDQLREEYGIGDNYAILMKDNYRELFDYLIGKGLQLDLRKTFRGLEEFPEEADKKDIPIMAVNTTPSFTYGDVVFLKIYNNLVTYWTTSYNWWGDKQRNEHKLRQLKTYNVTLEMHTDATATTSEFESKDLRKCADLVIMIGEFIIDRDIQACIPQSIGVKSSSIEVDYSKVVYHGMYIAPN